MALPKQLQSLQLPVIGAPLFIISNPDLVLGVTGCMAQRIGDELLGGPRGVDLVAGPDTYRGLGDLIEGIQESSIERGQSLLDLDDYAPSDRPSMGQLKITMAQFFRVNGGSTQNRGVEPDIKFPSYGEPGEYN